MEVWVDAYEHRRHMIRQRVQLHTAYHYDRDKTDEEHHTADQTEEMHRLLAKFIQEPQGHQIQVTVHEAVNAELACSELAFAVLYDLLPDLCETGILR